MNTLQSLWELFPRKSIKLWHDKWIFHHYNAPVREILRVHEFLDNKSITKMDHSPYSAPCDFWPSPKLKNAMKGQNLLMFLTPNAT
jgi:hypothetical protein